MILTKLVRRASLPAAAFLFLSSFAPAHASFSSAPNADSLGVNNSGSIQAVAIDTTTGIEYIGGSFTYVGPPTGNSAVLDTATHVAQTGGPKLINGEVDAIISDGAGGYYAGGRFTQNATTFTAICLIHVLSDGSVDTTVGSSLVTCSTGAHVYSLALNGTTLYAGGSFTTVDGQSRTNLASIDTTTGHVTTWNPTVNGTVYALLVNSGTVYVGTNNGSSDLNAFDASTGVQTSFAPAVSGSSHIVYSLAISGDGTTLYAGGRFTTVHTLTRNNLVAIDTGTGVPTAWNPAPDSYVYSLALDGTNLYVGGSFSNIGGATRNSLAVVDTGTGTAGSWNPGPDGEVHGLAFDGSTVYAAGYFSTIGSTGRMGLAAIDKATGALTSWDTETDLEGFTVALSGTKLYVGGDFASAGGVQRTDLAAIDTTTNTVTSWSPVIDTSREVDDLLVHNGTLYAGGTFNVVDGLDRYGLAAFDTSTGNLSTWDPAFDIDGSVYSLAAIGQNIYVGGNFTEIGSTTGRSNIAAIDATTGLATSWNPILDGEVDTLATDGNTVYASGYFTTVGADARAGLAAIDATTGLATSWDPNPDSAAYAIVPVGSLVYLGGDFTTIGGASRNYIAAIDSTTGVATTWNPNAQSDVFNLAIIGTSAYVGGFFSSIGGQTRNHLAEIDLTTGAATSWDPSPSTYPNSFTTDGSALYAGGDFYSFNSVYQPYHAQFGTAATPTGPVDTTPPVAGSSGTVTVTGVSSSGLTLNWTKATDNTDAQSALQYRVYQSGSNNITGVTNAETNGTALGSGYSTDINTLAVTGLSASTPYYFTVIVKDAAGNKTAYTTATQTTSASTSGGSSGGSSRSRSGSGTSIQTQVQNLLAAGRTADAQALMAQWPTLFPTQTVGAGAPATGTTPSSLGGMIRDLTIGSTGADVTALQTWLLAKGFSIPAGATGYFGAQTRAALAAFQKASAITPAVGYFGPITRAHIATH